MVLHIVKRGDILKTKLQVIANSLAVLLICTLLFSLLFASLYYFAGISSDLFHICNWISGVLAFIGGGCMLGYKINKKALLHAFVIAILLAIPMFILSGFSLMRIIENITKCIAYMLSTCITFNVTHPDH